MLYVMCFMLCVLCIMLYKLYKLYALYLNVKCSCSMLLGFISHKLHALCSMLYAILYFFECFMLL
jgi:hypothetical protein